MTDQQVYIWHLEVEAVNEESARFQLLRRIEREGLGDLEATYPSDEDPERDERDPANDPREEYTWQRDASR